MEKNDLYLNTVSDTLLDVLNTLMKQEVLNSFRLVGGTSLSLQLGHRMSVDIDLFTDAEYNSIDFKVIDKMMSDTFSYVDMQYDGNLSFGKSYYLGNSKSNTVKVDLFYTDPFIHPVIEKSGIRMASLEEIVAMKMEVIGQNGRKKDFWDIHELMEVIPLETMFELHHERYPYSHTNNDLKNKLTDFEYANSDFDPICLRGKYWEIIREDIEEAINNLSNF